MSNGTDLIETELIKIGHVKPIELFCSEGAEWVLQEIADKVKDFGGDVETEAGRKKIKSVCRRIASSKTLIDDVGKELVSGWKSQSKAVDVHRKKIKDGLDALKAATRKPLTDLEDAEKAEAQRIADRNAAELERLRKLEQDIASKALAERLKNDQKLREEQIARIAAKEATEVAEAKALVEKQKLEAEKKPPQKAFGRKSALDTVSRAHASKINNEALEALSESISSQGADDYAKEVLIAIVKGQIPHVSIKY